jgi:hypothetical protein
VDFEAKLKACSDQKLGEVMIAVLHQLFDEDMPLLQNNVSERTIAATLACHMKPYFKGWHVDPEYNKVGEDPKSVYWNDQWKNVIPDIIVHVRATDKNLLVIELKKSSNQVSSDQDVAKLEAMRKQLVYKHALFLRIGVQGEAGTITECEWIVV